MTLNCCKVEFSRNFAWFRVFRRLQHGTLSFARWRYQHFSETVLHNAVARLLSVSYGFSCNIYPSLKSRLPCSEIAGTEWDHQRLDTWLPMVDGPTVRCTCIAICMTIAISMSVRLDVRQHISKTRCANFTKFSARTDCGRGSILQSKLQATTRPTRYCPNYT